VPAIQPPQTDPPKGDQHQTHQLGHAQTPTAERWHTNQAKGIEAQPFNPDPARAVGHQINAAESPRGQRDATTESCSKQAQQQGADERVLPSGRQEFRLPSQQFTLYNSGSFHQLFALRQKVPTPIWSPPHHSYRQAKLIIFFLQKKKRKHGFCFENKKKILKKCRKKTKLYFKRLMVFLYFLRSFIQYLSIRRPKQKSFLSNHYIFFHLKRLGRYSIDFS
jgi:hypothetical protein